MDEDVFSISQIARMEDVPSGESDEENDEENEKDDDEGDDEPNFWILGTSPLSDDLKRLEEEHRRQIEEARQWVQEEEDADVMIRRDLEELQIAEQRNHELSARLIAPDPEIPPEVQERLDDLEKTVKSLQEQVAEKGSKLSERNESYAALLSKFNSMADRLLNTDQEFKQTLSRVKTEYEELEAVLKGKTKTYQDLNKQLELTLNQKEEEISNLRENLADYERMKSTFDEVQNQLDEANKSTAHLNKMTIKLKERLKSLKAERDSLLKEKEAEPIEPLKQRIAQLEAENNALIEESKEFESVELLKNRITLLEEEKGNLQLQLVDLDELKESAESTKHLCESLEREKFDLESALRSIEAQNAELLKERESSKNVSTEHEMVIAKLKEAMETLTDEKVSAVLRSVEIEETLGAREKEIAILKDSLRILEAEKVETSRQSGAHPDGDSELMSDYNMSNGLQVKLTVLQNELDNYRERERVLQESRDELEAKLREICGERDALKAKVGSIRKDDDAKKLEESLAERDQTNNELQAKLGRVCQNLAQQEEQCATLRSQLDAVVAEKEKLLRALSEKGATKETTQPSTGQPSTSDPDTTVQKLKKLAAMYKKKCGELEGEVEQLKATLNKKNDDCSVLASERSCLEHDVLNQASRYQQTFNEMQRLETELAELYSFVNEFKNVANDSLSQIVDPRRVAEALAMMSAWSSRTGTALPPSSYMPQSCITSDIEELRRILSEKQAAIQELEKDKNELGDLVSANQQELELLKELYEKEAAKNEKFYADLMGLEGEMSQSKSDLLARLEEVTSALQGRENYIEILEQDIVNMKTKMFSIESGMDDKHRELKDRAQLMLSKLEEAELMSQTFDKYKNEVENKIKSLKESEEKTKSQLIDAQVALESSQEEIEATRLRNSILENEKEQLSAKVSEMEGELETLRDIRNAYNNTLDTIEELNGGLKEAMDGFVAKSEKLDRIESERQVLINKLTDLEDAFGDLEKKLELSERANILLQGNSEQLARQLTEAQKELDSLRANQAGTDLLQKELSELSGSYDEKISVLELSKQKLEQLLTVKSQEIETLQVNWQQAETALRLSCDSRIAEVEASSRAQIQSALAELESLRQSRPTESSMQSSQTSPLPEPSRKTVAAAGESFENPFDDEDGWGWSGGENAAQPDAGEVSLLQESSRIAELMSSIQSLRSEKDRAVEELEAMKLNYKKVLKKLKDMKAEKAKPSSSGFSDLDLAVQEELRSENDALQGKLADLTKQFDSLKREKESLSKRVDTLVSANEQLIDMKERQDIEVQMWQKRSTELTNQVQNLQWSLEGMSSEGGNDPELALKINALAAENEELKSILNGHRDEMDRALAREQDLEQEILDLKGQLAELEKSAIKDQKPAASVGSAAAFFQQPGMVADGQQLKVQVESLLAENQKMKTTVEEKDREIRTAIDQVSELEQKLASLEIAGKSSIEHQAPAPTAASLFQAVVEEPRKPEDALENEKLRIELNDLKNQLSQNSVREQELQLEIEQLKNQVATRITEMEEVRVQKTTPISTSQTLPGSDPELQRKFDALTLENDDLKRMLNEMKTEISQIEGREKLLQQEVNRLKNVGTAAPALPVQSAAMLFQGSAQPFVDVFDSLSSNLAPASEPHSSIIETDASHQELQQKLEALANENGRLLQKIEDDASRILNFESQVSSQKAYFDEQVKELEQNFQKALMERDEDNAHLVCSVSAKEQALKNATKELQAVRDQFKNVAEIKAKLEEYERENANLRSELDGLKNYLEVSREAAENEHLSAMGPLKNQISILEEAKAKIVALLESKESEIEAYQRDLQGKEQNLRELNQQLKFYHQEVERLKSQSEPNLDESNVLAEIDRLSAAVGELQTTIKNQQEQLGDKDRIILELQHEIRVLQSVSDSAYTSSGEEERLQYSVSFLESERQRLENLVQDRLSEVAKYDQELEQLRKAASQSGSSASADISTCAAQIEEKDKEINRLTKAVVEIQERLLLSEQGKLNPDLKVVQNKLDQALYALHARDLKIEEMTLEIMQLLEERDSLQFRLSDAMRRSAEPSRGDTPKSPIHEKLSELHAGYKKDPLVQTEREARHAQQMQLYSENPPNASEESMPDYGIFNWFFGGSSTPSSQLGVNDGS